MGGVFACFFLVCHIALLRPATNRPAVVRPGGDVPAPLLPMACRTEGHVHRLFTECLRCAIDALYRGNTWSLWLDCASHRWGKGPRGSNHEGSARVS
jgi:hypothetical protein